MSHWLLLFCTLVGSAPPSPAVPQGNDEERIRLAIVRGVRYLRSAQQPDGTWGHGSHTLGMTALAGLALAENGVDPDDPALARAYEYVRVGSPSELQTYDISLAILFLSRMAREEDRDLVRGLGERLLAGQLTSGGWSYFCPQSPPAAPAASLTNRQRNKPAPARLGGRIAAIGRRSAGLGDNSNTQFAVLGIWTAGRAGLDVREAMAEVDKRFRTTQSPQGGWGYHAKGDTSSMSCAGLMALVLAKGHHTLENQLANRRPDRASADGPAGRPKMESDPRIDAGIRRVAEHASGMGPGSTLYFLWSIERVGVALGTPQIGNIEWYARGSAVIVQAQGSDGSWRSAHGELPDTCFALLFLRRSNLTQGMPQLVTGRGAEANSNQMRSGTLDQLIRTVRPAQSDDDEPAARKRPATRSE